MDFYSWAIYVAFMLVSCLLANKAERSGYNPVWVFVTYVFVVSFWAVRYEIGYDYVGYMSIFGDIHDGRRTSVEPAYYLLNRLFSYSPTGYVGVMAVMAAASFFFLFKLFVRERILLYGLFFSLAFQFQFMIINQVRQAFVITVFLWALRFVEDRKYWRYILLMASMMLIHLTAGVVGLVALLMARIKLPRLVWFIMIMGSYAMYLAGMFKTLGTKLMMSVQLYEQYHNSAFRMMAEEHGFSIVMLFWIIIALYILYYSRSIDRPVLFNIYMCGIVLYIVFFEFHLINRLLQYFLFTNIVLISVLCKNQPRKGIPLMIISFVAFNLLALKSPGYYGTNPYKTIFQEQIKKYQ